MSERPETRDIGVFGPVDGMNNPSAEGPYFRIVTMKGDNQHRFECLISRGAADNLCAELAALLGLPKPIAPEPDLPTAIKLINAALARNRRMRR